jgi:SPP1 family phage portal protein
MDSFLYKYKDELEGKVVEKAKVYTAEDIYTYINNSGKWTQLEVIPNLFGKIPVVYVEQDEPEWEQVGVMIDNFENRISRLSDTNDYFAEPLLKIFGKVAKMPNKDEIGKILEFDMTEGADGKVNHGDAEYAVWDHTPESIKIELETSWDTIFAMSSTPDLSFNNLKGIGNVAELTLKLLFIDAFIAREEKMEIFDPALRRCISVVTAGIENYTNIKFNGDTSLDEIDVSFSETLPSGVKEAIDTLITATGGKPILSQETAAAISPFTSDSEEEIARLREEGKAVPNESYF